MIAQGTIVDRSTDEVLPGAHIYIVKPNGTKIPVQTMSGADGYFEAPGFNVGDKVGVSYIGYGLQIFNHIQGYFEMQPQVNSINEVVITANKPKPIPKPKESKTDPVIIATLLGLLIIVVLFVTNR